MEFLSGGKLTAAIKTLLKEPNVRCAVAFWGKGCENWLKGDGARVICNLASGGTNPHALKKLKIAELRQYDSLHAKVFIGENQSIVGSANVSSNGLGFEGDEQNGWHEAGVLVDTSDDLTSWFEDLWEGKSRSITLADWKEAARKWALRQQFKPTLPDFSSFDVYQEELPFLDWYVGNDWQSNKKSIIKQLGRFDESVEDLIGDGVDIEDPRDQGLLSNRWILRWRANKDGVPATRSKLEFNKISANYIEGAYTYKNSKEAGNSLLAVEQQPPIPFDPNEPKFRDAFLKVLSMKNYECFRNMNYTGSYFQPCIEQVEPFWSDLKAEYELAI